MAESPLELPIEVRCAREAAGRRNVSDRPTGLTQLQTGLANAQLDYCGVDPIFGTPDEFDTLRARAHALKLKVVMDQVWSHTAIELPWFEESRSCRDNLKADWYVWAEAKPDGGPPNNWQSWMVDPTWTWEPRRQRYYLHNFLPQMPDQNFHQRKVQDAMLDGCAESGPCLLSSADRRLPNLRRRHAALRMGSFEPVYVDNQLLVVLRQRQDSAVLLAFNLSDSSRRIELKTKLPPVGATP